MVPWHEIDSIFLDMDGTLLDLHFDNYFWQEHVPLRFSEQHNIDIAEAKSQLVPRFQAAEGTMDWYCLDHWSRELGLDIVSLKKEIEHLIAVHTHVVEFLEAARSSNKRLVLLTNAHAGSLSLKMERTGIADAFDALVCAHDLGYPKEDMRFWSRLVKIENFDPERTLFIDDSLPILRMAREYGIRHLLAVKHPDSQTGPKDVGEFSAIESFEEIMPVNGLQSSEI